MESTHDSGSPAFPRSSEVLRLLLTDVDFQARLEDDPHATFSDQGLHLPPDLEIRVHRNTDDTFYIALPPDPNIELSDEALSAIAGGKSASSAATLSSGGTFPTSASTAGTAGTAASMS